jgi:chromate transporter
MTMQDTAAAAYETAEAHPEAHADRGTLRQLTAYFLTLGTIGFGGPVALVGYMQRDLVERRRWIDDEEYKLGLALAQIMPGPLAAQLAMAIGYFTHGVLGATLVGLAFVLPSFLMVLALSALYVAFGGLWWMQAVFYGVSAAVIAIIAIASDKLARKVNGRDPLLWGIFAMLFVVTAVAQAELAEFFLVAGLLVLLVKAPPQWLRSRLPVFGGSPGLLTIPALALAAAVEASTNVLWEILLFFTKSRRRPSHWRAWVSSGASRCRSHCSSLSPARPVSSCGRRRTNASLPVPITPLLGTTLGHAARTLLARLVLR